VTRKKNGKPKEAEKTEDLNLEIRAVARQLYEERDARNGEGDELSDWLMAERLVRAKHGL
jgi:hypothetical protein